MPEFNSQIHTVSSFQSLISTSFSGDINAMCWNRNIEGDFSEIVQKVEFDGNMVVLEEEDLLALSLSAEGQLAREIILEDMRLLKAHGASPILNVIDNYDEDDSFPLFPTDVYSWHVDRSPIPFDTFLCTYYGASSDILPNDQAIQKILISEIRTALLELHDGTEGEFEEFLVENFFDLHYQPLPDAQPVNLGIGHLWRLAIDHPDSKVLPCIHRAPREKKGERRLMMIC